MGVRLSPPRLHSRTAGPAQWKSTTLSMHCNWRISVVKGPRERPVRPHNRDIGHGVQQLGNVHGQTNSLDHEKLPLRHVRDVDDLDGLQLRRLHGFSSLDHGHHVGTLHLVHTGQDAEYPGLGDARRERDARCIITSKTTLHMPLPWLTTSVVLSFWFMTAMIPGILGMSTTEGNTARRGT